MATLIVAAMDFGTTFSGYAFSTKAEFETNPLSIHTNQAWKQGTVSIKCPTCILFDEKKEFVAFGYDAEDEYTEIQLEKRQNEFYFFKNFKMSLYNEQVSPDSLIIEDVVGKSLSAKFVFTASIKALKDHFHGELKTRGILGSALREDEISWVLTVPSIWTEQAKKFMRICAKEAGLDKNLTIALEPEAASIYCQCVPLVSSPRDSQQLSVGTKFMIVDIGGGTTDIVVQKKLTDGKFQNLCKPCGSSCGGTDVDKEFLNIMSDIIGITEVGTFKRDYPYEYLDLCREFETLKQRKIDGRPIRATIPLVALDKFCRSHFKKDFVKVLKSSKHRESITHVTGDKIKLSEELFLSLFKSTNTKIIQLIEDNLIKPEIGDISVFYLVGGFSESFVVQEAIKKAFPDKTVVIIPESSIAVLKGAVLYGHNPSIIASRVVRYTYGISSTEKFDPAKHDKKRTVEIDGVKRCRDTFQKLITANTSVVVGEIRSHTFKTIEPYQTFANLRIFYSPRENPQYIDEYDCKKFGEVRVEIKNPSKHKIEIEVDFQFGLTELVVTAKQKGQDSHQVLKLSTRLF